MAGKSTKGPEKSQFSITCNLLSQYIKQKRNLGGDLIPLRAHEAKGSIEPPTIMNLFPGGDVSGDADPETKKIDSLDQNTTKPMDLFPQHAPPFEATSIEENERDREKAQLTIFYSGKVLVFNNFSADMAKDLIEMASKTCSPIKNFDFATPSSSIAVAMADQPPKCPAQASDAVASTSGDHQDGAQSSQPQMAQTTGSNMPVARRASLHRFLEKRKDRINAKAPYQVNGSMLLPGKPEESQSWLGLGPQASKPGSSNENHR